LTAKNKLNLSLLIDSHYLAELENRDSSYLLGCCLYLYVRELCS